MIRAFALGLLEFRRDVTTSFVGESNEHAKYEWYDLGRDLAHRLTLRTWDEAAS